MSEKIKVFVSKECPHCVDAKKQLKDCPNIEFINVDSPSGRKLADELNIEYIPFAVEKGKEIAIKKALKKCKECKK